MRANAVPDGFSVDASILRELAGLFKQAGLRPLEALALWVVHAADAEMMLKELAGSLRLTAVQASRLVNALEDAGMVVRVAGSDRRYVVVGLDEAGWDALDALEDACEADASLEELMTHALAFQRQVGEVRLRYGITAVQSACFVAVTSLGLDAAVSSTAKRVSNMTGISRTSVYDALFTLRNRGLLGRGGGFG